MPRKRTPEIEETVLRALSVGTPLSVVCRQVGVDRVTWYNWMEADDKAGGALRIAYEAARDKGADALAEQCLDIIDEQPEYVTGDTVRIDAGYVAWQRARVETRLKLLAKWHPKKYGDKVQTELTGANGGSVKVDNSFDPAAVAAVGAALRASRQKETTNGDNNSGG